jgi:L-arabinose isomerase
MAMLTLKALGHPAQYHEFEVLDGGEGFLLASSGEHDIAFAGERPRLVRNGWFPDDAHPSICACFTGSAGSATVLGFAQLDAPTPLHRFVTATGFLAPERFPRVGTAHGMFRFAHESAVTAWEAWARSGVGLHSACTVGDIAPAVDLVGRFLDVEVIRV